MFTIYDQANLLVPSNEPVDRNYTKPEYKAAAWMVKSIPQ